MKIDNRTSVEPCLLGEVSLGTAVWAYDTKQEKSTLAMVIENPTSLITPQVLVVVLESGRIQYMHRDKRVLPEPNARVVIERTPE